MAQEMFGASAEYAILLTSPVYKGIDIPRGDGHSLLLIPGFMGDKNGLRPMNNWLKRIGYSPETVDVGKSTLGFNTPWEENIEQAEKQLIALARRSQEFDMKFDGVTVIGHSLGGMIARNLARRRPNLVDKVISLGSPHSPKSQHAESRPVVALAESFIRSDRNPRSTFKKIMRGQEYDLLKPPNSVKTISIYTHDDGVCNWKDCVDPNSQATNIEVAGTHMGLIWNAAVYRLLGRELAA